MGSYRVLKVDTKPSKYGGKFHYIYMKSLADGSSARTCVQDTNGNYARWSRIVQLVKDGKLDDLDIIVNGARVLRKGLIDADSMISTKIGNKQEALI